MPAPKSTKKWVVPVATFIAGALFGTGGVWQYANVRLRQQEAKLAHIRECTALRDKIVNSMQAIYQLSEETSKLPEAPPKGLLSARERRRQLLIDDCIALERKLAELEKRKPRPFADDWTASGAPQIKVKAVTPK